MLYLNCQLFCQKTKILILSGLRFRWGLSLLLLFLTTAPLGATDYRPLLQADSSLRYEHWNLDRQEVTGYSHFRQRYDPVKQRWEERNENVKPDGKPFTRKQLIFQENGELERYIEEDLRKPYRVETTYRPNQAETRLQRDGEVRTFRQDLSSNTVPLELILLHLRHVMPQLLDGKTVRFPIYASMLALELEENGFPQSLSQIEMQAEPGKRLDFSAPWGSQESLQVEVSPASWTIRALLPAEKSRFRFTIATTEPYLILVFEEGQTRHSLIEWQPNPD
jgi:hypothetical protein